MLRGLFTFIAAASAVLCLGACVLCVRSYRVRDGREFDRHGIRWEVASDHGRLWLDNGPQRRIERAPLTEAERQTFEARKLLLDRRAALDDYRRLSDPRAMERTQTINDHAGALRRAGDQYLEAVRRQSVAQAQDARKPKTPPYVRSIPFVRPIAGTIAVPLLWLAAWVVRCMLLRRRKRRGLCVQCGYDLRGSPSGRCPECGTAGKEADSFR